MSYTYNSFQQALAIYMALPNAAAWKPTSPMTASPWPNFDAALPSIVDYAEQRIYRELDLLDATEAGTFTPDAADRYISFAAISGLQILILKDVNVLEPATGERVPLMPVSRPWINSVYGGTTPAAMPEYFAMFDDTTILVGPFPDQTYQFEFIGKARPIPIYQVAPKDGTQATFLTTILPDLFLAAAMVNAAGYQKNFGSQSDNPQMAMSWETQYQTLFKSAQSEEVRKKFREGTTSELTPPMAMPMPMPGMAPPPSQGG